MKPVTMYLVQGLDSTSLEELKTRLRDAMGMGRVFVAGFVPSSVKVTKVTSSGYTPAELGEFFQALIEEVENE